MSQATDTTTDAIPVVDLAPLLDGSDPQRVADALHRASAEVGFIYVANHGIDPALIAAARRTALGFFRQEETAKLEVEVSAQHRGFLRVGGAVMGDDKPPDLKESFIWGHQDSRGHTPQGHPLRGPNRWPARVPELQDLSMRYFAEAHRVAEALMRGFALGLGLAPDFFLRHTDAPMSRASYVYYPPGEGEPERMGVGEHTDFGVLTVLCQDDVGGLEVLDLQGRWIAAPPIADTLIVNVGDLLGRWTNGAYRSTPHRVINRSARERLSLVLAWDPNPETQVDAAQVFPAGSARLDGAAQPISCGDYLSWRFEKAFAYRQRGR